MADMPKTAPAGHVYALVTIHTIGGKQIPELVPGVGTWFQDREDAAHEAKRRGCGFALIELPNAVDAEDA